MLRVAKLEGGNVVPGWVTYCAVASIGLGVGPCANTEKDLFAEASLQIIGAEIPQASRVTAARPSGSGG